jgi:hypothetical protein
MLTAAVRDLHCCYPGQFLTDVRTACPELWENNPYITPLTESESGVEMLDCAYPLIDRCNEAPYHCLHGFTAFLNERLGLDIKPTQFKGEVHLSELEKSWYSQVHELTGDDTPFWIIASGGKYDATVKWWDPGRYQAVVDCRLFQHRNTDKWDLLLHNRQVPDFWFEAECREYLRELQGLWDGRMSSIRPLRHAGAAFSMAACMISCPAREALRRQTLDNLAATDWDGQDGWPPSGRCA